MWVDQLEIVAVPANPHHVGLVSLLQVFSSDGRLPSELFLVGEVHIPCDEVVAVLHDE